MSYSIDFTTFNSYFSHYAVSNVSTETTIKTIPFSTLSPKTGEKFIVLAIGHAKPTNILSTSHVTISVKSGSSKITEYIGTSYNTSLQDQPCSVIGQFTYSGQSSIDLLASSVTNTSAYFEGNIVIFRA